MDPLNKKYYKISEVAEILHLPASTLRYWEKYFTVIRPKRNDKGTRFYTSADIEKIAMVHYLVKEKGLKLEAAQEQIRANPTGVERQSRALIRLRGIRQELVALLNSLGRLKKS
ncbi:MAG: MerR family transcriptional regulator [Bacteroidales bacterium]|nr:MerR family transcriptional regulator [Bacteroidales bacterium]